jgi:hypothetical protein
VTHVTNRAIGDIWEIWDNVDSLSCRLNGFDSHWLPPLNKIESIIYPLGRECRFHWLPPGSRGSCTVTQIPAGAENDDCILKMSATEKRGSLFGSRIYPTRSGISICNRSVCSEQRHGCDGVASGCRLPLTMKIGVGNAEDPRVIRGSSYRPLGLALPKVQNQIPFSCSPRACALC